MDPQKKKYLEKLLMYEEDKDLASFIELKTLVDKQDELIEKQDETNQILQILAEKEIEVPDQQEIVIPDEVTVKNLPEVQKVEVINQTKEQKLDTRRIETLLEAILRKKDDTIDYTPILSELADILEREKPTKEAEILALLQGILDKNYPEFIFPDNLVNNNRVKVEVDKVGGMNAASLLTQNTFTAKQDEIISTISTSVLAATNNSGERTLLNATKEGHLEVSLHDPKLPFGSIHTEKMTPVFQTDAVYGVNPQQMIATTGLSVGTGANSGSATAASNMFTCATGTTQYSFASLQSRRRLRYRPGQGFIGRFAGKFSTPAASSIVVAGFGTAEAGYYVGYNGTSFGFLHSTGGVRELQTLTITTPSTATNDYVVTLPNGATATVTATNNNNANRTAYEIAQGTYPGWKASSRANTVIFLADSAGPKTGTFSLAQTGAVTPAAGTCAETTAGVASTDTWIPKTSWNFDKLDGNGVSGFTLDPSKGNVYQINMQYLGFGTVALLVEVTYAGGNNPEFVPVHVIQNPNALTAPHLSQPSLPFTMAAYSSGSTTDVSVSVGSFGGFIEGDIVRIGPRSSPFTTTGVTSSTSAYVPIFTVKNDLTYSSRANQAVSQIISIHGAAKSNTGLTTFFIIKNATLTGNVNFASFASGSALYWDQAATACTFSDNSQIWWSGTVSETGDFNYGFSDHEITLQPGESITVAVRSVTATAVCVASLNIREDQ